MTLNMLKTGQKCKIQSLNIQDAKIKRRMMDIGFIPGNIVEIWKKQNGKEDLTIVICCGTKLAIRNSLLKLIEVKLLQNIETMEETM